MDIDKSINFNIGRLWLSVDTNQAEPSSQKLFNFLVFSYIFFSWEHLSTIKLIYVDNKYLILEYVLSIKIMQTSPLPNKKSAL